MKKDFFLTFLAIFLNFSLSAQFESYIDAQEYPNYISNYPFNYPSIIETDEGNYIFSVPMKLPSINAYSDMCIFLLNEEGEFLDDIYIDTSIIRTRATSLQKVGNKFLIFGHSKNTDTSIIKSDKIPILLEISPYLDIVRIDTLPYYIPYDTINTADHTNIVLPTNGFLNKENNLVLYHYSSLMTYEIDTATYEILKTKKDTEQVNYCQDFQQILDGRYIVSMSYDFFTNHDNEEHLWSLDEDFNTLHSDSLEAIISNYPNLKHNGQLTCIKMIDSTRFYYSYHNSYVNWDLIEGFYEHNIALMKIKDDNSFEFIKKVRLQENDTISMQINRQNSLVFTDKNNLFASSYGGINFTQNSFPSYPNSIMLTRLDSNLNIKSQYFYGNDGAYYLALDSKATEDGGCVIASWRYTLDENNEIDTSQFYILKVNEEGTLGNGSNTEDISSSMKQAIIYPSPVKDAFTIRYGQHLKDVKIELFNMNGQQVLDKNLRSNLTKINIENLSSGTYIIHIISENKIIEKDKLIKE